MRPLLFALVLFCIATQFSPYATADPPGSDPHLPNLQFGYCPGGQGGFSSYQWCDGQQYPDGSFWHQFLDATIGQHFTLNCVVNNGSPLPPPAPPGGCGGAV